MKKDVYGLVITGLFILAIILFLVIVGNASQARHAVVVEKYYDLACFTPRINDELDAIFRAKFMERL